MSAQSAIKQRRASASTAPMTCHIRPTRELDGSLCVTVETSQLLRVRKAIVQSSCKPIGIVRAMPLACGTKVRLLIALRPECVQRVMDAIESELAPGARS